MKYEITRTETSGHNIHDSSFQWTNVEEYIIKDNRKYLREYTINRTDGVQETQDFPNPHFKAIDDNNVPAIICGICFGDLFKLRFGWYEVIAVCAACDNSDVVYDG